MDIINSEILKEIMQINKQEAQGILPELIKRLIISSVKDIASIRIPDKDDIWAPGFDGIVESNESTFYVDSGISVWEFGTCNDPLSKIESDCSKRTKNSLGINKSEATFYLVIPTIWAYRKKTITQWENEHKDDWKKVHVIDASELCDWINSAPAACAWLLESFYDRKRINFKSVTKAFENFSNKTKPVLSKALFIKSREQETERFYGLINKPIIRIKGVSFYDAIGFTISALYEHADFRNTAIVIDDYDTFQVLDRVVKDKLFVFNFSCNNDVNSENNNRVVLCFNNFDTSIKADITIDKQSKLTFELVLKEMGLSDHDASRLCKITNRNVISLIRQIPGNSNITRPEWTSNSSLYNLVPLLFMGKINKDSNDDKMIASQLLGEDYKVFETLATNLRRCEDSPIKEVEGVYAIVNYEEVWEILKLNTSDSCFDNLVTTVKKCIEGYSDSQYNFNIGLVRSLINNLVYFSENSQKDREEVSVVVNDLLNYMTARAEWRLIFELIQTLSKAAPCIVIQFIENNLKKEDSVIRDSFGSNDYNNDYCKILWALESLMWFDDSKIRACKVLFELYYSNYSYRISNTPEESLLNELCLWNAKSGLSIMDKREVLLSEMKNKTEQIGMFAIKVITRKTCWSSIGATEKDKEEKEITGEQYYGAIIDITKEVIDIIKYTKSIKLFASLINGYYIIQPGLLTYMANEIDYSVFDAEALQFVRFEILKKIVHLNNRDDEFKIYIPYLSQLADKIKSNELLLQYLPFFGNSYDCPILNSNNDDDYQKAREEKISYRLTLYILEQLKY